MFVVLAMMGALLTLAGSAHAQAIAVVEAKIPFDFVAEDRKLPAGEYRIEPVFKGRLDRLMIRRKDGGAVTTVLTLPSQANELQTETRLIFHRYGNQYFLSQIWTSGQKLGRELLVGRAEQEVAKQNGSEKRLTVVAVKQK
jgi:hypothetical protein